MDNEQNKEQNPKTAILPKKKIMQWNKLSNFTKGSLGESLVCHQKIVYF